MKNNWFYIGIIAILCVVALQFWDTAPKLLNPEDAQLAARKNFPYAMIEKPHSRHYDTEGLLSYEFVADKLRHFRVKLDAVSEDDYTLLDVIEVTLHTQDGPWFVSADEGKLTDAGNTLALNQNVRIWQTMEDGGITELTTTQLVIYPNLKIVSTDEPVKITAPQGELEAVGMSVDLETQKIQLKSNVRGHHEPI